MILSILLNQIMYADDIALIVPSTKGLNILLKQCEIVVKKLDLKFNTEKSVIMIFRYNFMKNCTFPKLCLNGCELKELSEHRYLGYLVTNSATDDADIDKQRRILHKIIFTNDYTLPTHPWWITCMWDQD